MRSAICYHCRCVCQHVTVKLDSDCAGTRLCQVLPQFSLNDELPGVLKHPENL